MGFWEKLSVRKIRVCGPKNMTDEIT